MLRGRGSGSDDAWYRLRQREVTAIDGRVLRSSERDSRIPLARLPTPTSSRVPVFRPECLACL